MSAVSAIRPRRLSGRMLGSPRILRRMWSRSMVSTASRRYLPSRPMMASTSSRGRFQFSVEKA